MDDPPKEKWADLERTLRELQTQLADAVGENAATEHVEAPMSEMARNSNAHTSIKGHIVPRMD